MIPLINYHTISFINHHNTLTLTGVLNTEG
jgi:hypothetical protein